MITGNNVNNVSSDCAFPLNDIYLTSDNQAGTASTLRAATVTAMWDPNTESDLAGYKLSYGLQSGVYTTTIDVGNVTSWPLTLTDGLRYYFAVQAYNTSAAISPFSAEVFADMCSAARGVELARGFDCTGELRCVVADDSGLAVDDELRDRAGS